jgi:hypothetical protein
MVVGRYHLGSSHDLIPSSLICLYLEGEGRVCVGVFCGGKGDGKVGGIELGGVGRGTKK